MKSAAIAILTAAVLAGCGGGGGNTQTATAPTASAPAPVTTPTTPSKQPTATTNTPPPKHRTKRGSSNEPLRVSSPYTCNGKRLKAIRAAGPVDVKPAIVKPGQSFTVTVTDPKVKVAVVTLAGVAPKPITASGAERNGRVSATLKMPSYASCGNKLLEIEGDLSAEAYVGVSR